MRFKNIACIGQGFIGKNLSDNLEDRGFKVLRYSKTEGSKEELLEADLVIVAVPTPSTSTGFDDSVLIEVLGLLSPGTVVVIKSTILPTTCDKLNELYPGLIIMHNPEFLDENTARLDTDNPSRQILGIDISNEDIVEALEEIANEVFEVLPKCNYKIITGYKESAMIKYGANCFFFIKNVYFNTLYDYCTKIGADWNTVIDGITEDNRIGVVHTRISDKGGRGAGGHCLIKDMASYRRMFEDEFSEDDGAGLVFLSGAEMKNIKVLRESGKDKDLLDGVYGPNE